MFQEDYVKIKNENGRQEEYSVHEIFEVLNWLTDKFGLDWFPLANNVEKLGNETEVNGLGVAILQKRPRKISHAQGASYLGVVLEHVGILEWNNSFLPLLSSLAISEKSNPIRAFSETSVPWVFPLILPHHS
jgi:hypothetical protein